MENTKGLSPAWGGIISAGMGAIAQGAGALISGNQNRKHAEKMQAQQIQANKDAAREAREFQLQMYKRSQQDTTYSAMRKQMEDAGLNPALMYGQGGAPGVGRGDMGGNIMAAGASGAGGPIMDNPMQGMAGVGSALGLQIALANADIKVKEAQAKNIEADTEKKQGVDTAVAWAEWMNKGAAWEGQQLGNQYQEIRNSIEQATTDEQIAKVGKEVDLLAELIGKTRGEKKQEEAKGSIAEPMAIAGLANLLTDLEVKAEGIEKSKEERNRMRNQTIIEWAREENEDLARQLTEKLGTAGIETTRRGQDVGASNERRKQNTAIRVAKIQAGSKVASGLFGMLNNPEAMQNFVEEMKREDW